jgi:hypothetical protein
LLRLHLFSILGQHSRSIFASKVVESASFWKRRTRADARRIQHRYGPCQRSSLQQLHLFPSLPSLASISRHPFLRASSATHWILWTVESVSAETRIHQQRLEIVVSLLAGSMSRRAENCSRIICEHHDASSFHRLKMKVEPRRPLRLRAGYLVRIEEE